MYDVHDLSDVMWDSALVPMKIPGTVDSMATSALKLEQNVVEKQTCHLKVDSLDTKNQTKTKRTKTKRTKTRRTRVAIMNGVWGRVRRRHVGGTRTHFSPSYVKVMGTRRRHLEKQKSSAKTASGRKFKMLHETFVKDLATASEELGEELGGGGAVGTCKKQKSCTDSHERSIIDDLFGDI